MKTISREEIVRNHRQHIWPAYTSSEDHETREPLVYVKAEGVWLHDADGRKFIDGNGSWWSSTLGHAHPRLVKAIQSQVETLAHCALSDSTHEQAAMLAKELVDVAPPGLTRVHFSDDGSTAVEVAIKIALQVWQQNGFPKRRRFLSLGGAFHGDTTAAMSVGGLDFFRARYAPILFDVIRPPAAEDAQGWERTADAIDAALRAHGDEIAAVVVEPLIQGANGMRIFSPEILRRIYESAKHAKALFIADEVFTGYGRTGKMWACDHARITPDLLCTAKAFSGGMLPMAATLATEALYDGFRGDTSRALMHGHTFCGNPLGARVAREVLSVYRDESIVDQVARKSAVIQAEFEAMGALPGVSRTRSLGMVGALDLGSDGYEGKRGWRVYDEALARGAVLRPLGDTVYLTPAFTISDHELLDLLRILRESVEAAR